METEFSLLATSHIAKLMIFRGSYLGVMEKLKNNRIGRVNVVELVVLLTRGGRRIPAWIRNINTREINEEFPLRDLSEHELHKYFDDVRRNLTLHRVVPDTKNQLFATYLTGQVCATARSLGAFAGISKSTAHKWLYRCVEFKLLDVFATEHEVYYVQPALMQLVLVGTTDPKNLFRYELQDDLAELRRRSSNWLQRSKLVQRFDQDLRTYSA